MEFVNDQMDADVGSSVNEVILQPGSAHPQTLSRPDASGVSGNAGNVLGGQNASDSGYMLSVPPVDNGNIFGGQVGSGSSGSLDRQSNNKQYEQEQELPQQQMLLDGGNQQDQSPSQPVVIDWPAALEQCGGDQEFLIELLDDFWAEISSQLSTLKRMVSGFLCVILVVRDHTHIFKITKSLTFAHLSLTTYYDQTLRAAWGSDL